MLRILLIRHKQLLALPWFYATGFLFGVHMLPTFVDVSKIFCPLPRGTSDLCASRKLLLIICFRHYSLSDSLCSSFHLATIPITGTEINLARSFGAAVIYDTKVLLWKRSLSKRINSRRSLLIVACKGSSGSNLATASPSGFKKGNE